MLMEWLSVTFGDRRRHLLVRERQLNTDQRRYRYLCRISGVAWCSYKSLVPGITHERNRIGIENYFSTIKIIVLVFEGKKPMDFSFGKFLIERVSSILIDPSRYNKEV